LIDHLQRQRQRLLLVVVALRAPRPKASPGADVGPVVHSLTRGRARPGARPARARGMDRQGTCQSRATLLPLVSACGAPPTPRCRSGSGRQPLSATAPAARLLPAALASSPPPYTQSSIARTRTAFPPLGARATAQSAESGTSVCRGGAAAAGSSGERDRPPSSAARAVADGAQCSSAESEPLPSLCAARLRTAQHRVGDRRVALRRVVHVSHAAADATRTRKLKENKNEKADARTRRPVDRTERPPASPA
jgi:hypothetical protein